MPHSTVIREQVLVKSTETLRAEPDVDAIFLAGSLATGKADEFSDIDLRVVVRDEGYTELVSRRSLLPQEWGPFLYHQTVGPNFTVSYYDSLTKIDVFYYKVSEFRPSPWHSLGVKPILDRSGLLHGVIAESASLEFTANFSEMLSHVGAAVAHLVESAIRQKRGQLTYATYLAAGAASRLCTLEDNLRSRAPLGIAKIELRSTNAVGHAFELHLDLPKTLVTLAREAHRLLDELVPLAEDDELPISNIRTALRQTEELILSVGANYEASQVARSK